MEFEMGDRVEMVDFYPRVPSGTKGTVISPKRNGYYAVIWDNGYSEGGWNESMKKIVEPPPPETYTAPDGTIYRKLKSLSPESVYANGKYATCQEWKDEFDKYSIVWGFFAEPSSLKDFIDFCKQAHPPWLPWLVEHGYISAEKKKEKKVVVIEGVNWNEISIGNNPVYPTMPSRNPTTKDGWRDFLKKPPMKMTLEWEE